MGGAAYSQVLLGKFQRNRPLPYLKNFHCSRFRSGSGVAVVQIYNGNPRPISILSGKIQHRLRSLMHQFLNRMCTGVQQDAVHASEAEQSDRKVLGQQLVQADHTERLDQTNLELREIPE